ncbi:MAG: DUF2189 domain-containing protein [Burkholderiaceae bacterium]
MNPHPHEPATAAGPAAHPSAFDIGLHRVGLTAPLRWLQLGWHDFMRAPVIGVFYGASFAAMGWMLLLLFRHAPAYTLALSAGFLLAGPFLCLGLYDVSRRLERAEMPRLAASLVVWRERTGTMAVFGALLLILEMLWARASLVVFALSFDGMPDFRGSMLALLDPENLAFIVAYLAVGGLFAGIIFAIAVVAMPMILDRQTDAITAGLTSLRLCLTQPAVMLCWGAVITLLVVLAMLPGFAGLLIVAPVLGHASWHAYRATVAAPS